MANSLHTRQVEAFRALILAGSTVRAAEMMHITQPAVSRLIHEFQSSLNLVLFERQGNRLQPTHDALALYAEVERSYVGLERIAHAANELRNRRSGVLRIAAMPGLCNGFLPRFISGFMDSHPHLHLTLSGLVSPSVIDWVVSEQCDIGFVATPVEHASITSINLPIVNYVAVVPRNHRLSKCTVVRPQHFESENFVSLATATQARQLLDDIFKKHRVTRRIRAETPLSEIACALVAAGVGISIVDPFTAMQYSTSGIVVRPFSPSIELQIAAIHSSRRTPSSTANEFFAEFSKYVELFRHGQHKLMQRRDSMTKKR